MFRVNVSAKLLAPFRLESPEVSVLDLKARYRGAKYLSETLKILPQKPDDSVIDEIAERLGSNGSLQPGCVLWCVSLFCLLSKYRCASGAVDFFP